MKQGTIYNYYFLGIGGIGMSALARYYKHLGKNISGYDRIETPLTGELQAEGMMIHFEDNIALIPAEFKINKESTRIIYTPAIPADHSELQWFIKEGFTVLKRSEALGQIANNYKTIAIAGTHGKTTVTTLTAHLLNQSPGGCNAFFGGISKNYNTNLLLSEKSPFMVAEADEYDRSFHQLDPWLSVVTSTDADHLDIYGSTKEMLKAFEQFLQQTSLEGHIIIKKGLPIQLPEKYKAISCSYALNRPADFYAENISFLRGCQYFDLMTPTGIIPRLELGIPGAMNIENAVVASACALLCGSGEQNIRYGLKTFEGVKRRFDFQVRMKDFVYIDDYAHHPEELNACIGSARKLFPDWKITGIFQPHLFSRTRDLAEGFAHSLDQLDEIILTEIYPAREIPLDGISSESISSLMKNKKVIVCQKQNLLTLLRTKNIGTNELFLTMGAGDIDQFVGPLKHLFYEKLSGSAE